VRFHTRLPVLAWALQKGILVLVKRGFLKDLPDSACKNAKEAKKQGLAKIPQGLSIANRK